MIKLIDLLNEIKINDPTITPEKVYNKAVDIYNFYAQSDIYNYKKIDTKMSKIFKKYNWVSHDKNLYEFINDCPPKILIKIYKELKDLESKS